jgi:hypothetical protein
MDSFVTTPSKTQIWPTHVLDGALSRCDPSDADAAFAAGIALKSLDDLVRAPSPPGPDAGDRAKRSNAPPLPSV